MINKPFRLKILYTYLVTYAVILIMPLISFIYIINNNILTELQDQVVNANKNNLHRVREQTEQLFTEMEKIALSIIDNKRLLPFTIKENYYKTYEGIVELKNYKYANEFIFEIFYYIRGYDKIYGSSQSSDLYFLFNNIYTFEKWNSKDIYKDLNSIEKPFVRPVEKFKSQTTDDFREVVTYIYPIKPYATYATVIILIDNDKLVELFGNILKEYNENVIIVNNNYHVLTTMKKNNEAFDIYKEYIKDSLPANNSEIITLIDKEYMVMHTVSNKNGWIYISFVKTDNIMSKINNIKNLVYVVMIIIFMVGAFIITIAIYMNYIPLYKLTKKINEKLSVKINAGKVGNEVETMEIAINEIFATNKKHKEDIEKYRSVLRKYIFKELIKGNIDKKSNIDEVSFIRELYSESKLLYIVLIFKFIGCECNDGSINGIEEILKEVNNSPGRNLKIYSMIDSTEKQLVVFYFYNGDDIDDFSHNVRTNNNIILNNNKKRFGDNLICGAGNIYNDILSLARSYTEALKVLQFYMVEKSKRIFYFEDYKTGKEGEKDEYLYPFDDLRKLTLQLQTGNINQVRETLQKLINTLVKKNSPSFLLNCIFFEVYNILIKISAKINISPGLVIDQYSDIFNSYQLACSHTQTANSIYDKLMVACERMCTLTGSQKNKGETGNDNRQNHKGEGS